MRVPQFAWEKPHRFSRTCLAAASTPRVNATGPEMPHQTADWPELCVVYHTEAGPRSKYVKFFTNADGGRYTLKTW
jgi:hypothetical protein